MPRDSRIKLVGKRFEAVEAQIRIEELRQLERELHREWHAEQGEPDDVASVGSELTSDEAQTSSSAKQ